MWFAISEAGMGPVSRLTNTLLAGGRGRSGVEVGPDQIQVQMGGFKLTVPRASIRSASRSQDNVRGTYGMHSRSGRWLVNGSADGLVELTIEPPCYTERKPIVDVHQGKGEVAHPKPRRPRRIYRRPPVVRSALTSSLPGHIPKVGIPLAIITVGPGPMPGAADGSSG